ncbi:hypothetical protein GALMADRAFT_230061 [Galerina marginata CBS 339.88]|uniref:BTB domain-containing protein n=1 Tax=Galerina marginata (strain CBS 339.88) TaxID=685588 RepID=A0A067SK82_GALM3|nr:hypothetical protein GALMADRAFT_230061 [Galerina marginata CBS 339.88]
MSSHAHNGPFDHTDTSWELEANILQTATRISTQVWQRDLEQLFHHAKERYPDVVWEVGVDEDEDLPPGASTQGLKKVWGHRAIVHARAPPVLRNSYFSFPSAYPAGDHGLRPELEGSIASSTSVSSPRTASPFRASSSTTLAHSNDAPFRYTNPLRLTTSINPTLLANELKYLYTGKGFGEVYEFSNALKHVPDDEDADVQPVDKLRMDLLSMGRSRLYSDVKIVLTSDFGKRRVIATFWSHRFILASRSAYFADVLSSWPEQLSSTNHASTTSSDLPILSLTSPPFTPASLDFTLGFIYTGTLIFSDRSYGLSTAFLILKAAIYLSIPSLYDEIFVRIVQEMMHGLFHPLINSKQYEHLTGGAWDAGGCCCQQCAHRAPRLLAFALEKDVMNRFLEQGARRALVGLFGEGWCTPEFALLQHKDREAALKGVGMRTTVTNVFPLLLAAERGLRKVGTVIESWGDVVRDMLVAARNEMDELLVRQPYRCFERIALSAAAVLIETDKVGVDDGEKVEVILAAALRGVKGPYEACRLSEVALLSAMWI